MAQRDRLINRRRQGDLGEASAIEWLTANGALVFYPLGHSPDVDLVAELEGELLKIQVKTCVSRTHTPDGHERWAVQLATLGGNQSWTGVAKRFDLTKVDFLFILVGDGRRWLVPAEAVEGTNTIQVGGTKYSEFEIQAGASILETVFGSASKASRLTVPPQGERRSGRAGLDCKFSGLSLSGFESHLPHEAQPAKGERALGRAGQAIVRGKRQMTIPAKPYTEAGLEAGDRVRFRADGPGRIILERIEPGADRLAADDRANGSGPAADSTHLG